MYIICFKVNTLINHNYMVTSFINYILHNILEITLTNIVYNNITFYDKY
jgi:hypothetical protein